jgi:hypothetical protein
VGLLIPARSSRGRTRATSGSGESARRSDASDLDWKLLWVAAVAIGLLMLTGLIRAGDPDPCTVVMRVNGRTLQRAQVATAQGAQALAGGGQLGQAGLAKLWQQGEVGF